MQVNGATVAPLCQCSTNGQTGCTLAKQNAKL